MLFLSLLLLLFSWHRPLLMQLGVAEAVEAVEAVAAAAAVEAVAAAAEAETAAAAAGAAKPTLGPARKDMFISKRPENAWSRNRCFFPIRN